MKVNRAAPLIFAAIAAPAPAFAQSADDERVARLEAQIEALQAQLDELKKQVTARPVPSWKGAPELADTVTGFTFKPRGRLQYDNGYIDRPDALTTRNLGFNSRVRRVTLGAEGSIPGGFGYRVEFDFQNGNVGFEDVLLSYTPRSKAWQARLGLFETLNGLEQVTSSNAITFLERAAFNDAFLNTRRLGAAVALTGKDDRYRFEAGLFTAHGIDGSFDNDGWIAAGRAVWAPKLGEDSRLHLELNVQRREFQSNNNGATSTSNGAPSSNQIARYRARPNLQTTDVRFVDTGGFAAKRDLILGASVAGIFGPLYFTSEAQWLRADSYRPASVATGVDAFAGNSGVTPLTDPDFWGAHAEIGWFITGEKRGYGSMNTWSRPKVLDPLSKGGTGAFQLAARIDHLDLDDDALTTAPTTNFLTGATSVAALDARLGRGGSQTSLLLGLNWYPIDYVRLMLNYIHVEVEGGPLAAQARPGSAKPVNERSFSTDAVAVRAQVEF